MIRKGLRLGKVVRMQGPRLLKCLKGALHEIKGKQNVQEAN